MKRYEAMFILPESLKEDELEKLLDGICGEIKKLNGHIESRTRMGKRSFARRLKKQDAGHYVIVTFLLAPDKVSSLLARFKLNEQIMRVQIVQQIKPLAAAAVAKGEEADDGQS